MTGLLITTLRSQLLDLFQHIKSDLDHVNRFDFISRGTGLVVRISGLRCEKPPLRRSVELGDFGMVVRSGD